MAFNQKLGKPITFTKLPKNAQGYCQPNKDSICYNVSLNTQDADNFHYPKILKLASGTHTERILNRHKKHNEIYQKVAKKLVQRQNIQSQINSHFTPASNLKVETLVSEPIVFIQKRNSKNYKLSEKDSFK